MSSILRKLSLLLFSFYYLAYGQGYDFEYFNVDDGLAGSSITCLYQDRTGYLWVGTAQGGVSRYDGLDFETFTTHHGLVDNQIRSIVEDRSGRIWIGTMFGISVYDGVEFETLLDHEELKGTVNAMVCDDHGSIWIGAEGGIFQFDAKMVTKLDMSQFSSIVKPRIFSMFKDQKDRIWFGGEGFVLCMDHGEVKEIPVPVFPNNYRAYSFCEDKSGRIWIGTTIGTAYLENDSAKKVIWQNKTPSGRSLRADSHGDIWIGSFGRLSKWNSETGVEGIEMPKDLEYGGFRSIIEDREGNMWFGTGGLGIIKVTRTPFIEYSRKNGLPRNKVTAIEVDRSGRVHLGQVEFVVNFKDESSFQPEIYDLVGKGPVNSMFLDNAENLWVGVHHHGVVRIQNGTMEFMELSPDDHKNNCVATIEDKAGYLWFGSYGGGVFQQTEKGLVNYTESDGLASDIVHDLLEDYKGNIWIATAGGLSRFNGKTFENFDTSDGLSHMSVNSLYEDKDHTLWIGTLDGLCKYRGGIEPVLNGNSGLKGNVIRAIIQDDLGKLWIGTNLGVARFDPDRYLQTGEIDIRNFGSKDGFKGGGCRRNLISKDPKGALWIGTTNGLYRCDPKWEDLATPAPETLIRGVRLFWDPIHQHREDTGEVLSFRNSFAYDENHLTFDFIGISFSDPGSVTYLTRLVGFESGWTTHSKEKFTTYSNLSPGRYEFQVKSCNGQGVCNNSPEKFAFVIVPPFWQTWWFRLLLLVSLIGLVYLFFKVRVLIYNGDMVKELLLKAQHYFNREQFLFVKVGGEFVRIEVTQVQYIKAAREYVEIFTPSKKYLVRSSFKAMEEKVNEIVFLQKVHRSFIINLDRVESFSGKNVVINEVEIPVSEPYKKHLGFFKKNSDHKNPSSP